MSPFSWAPSRQRYYWDSSHCVPSAKRSHDTTRSPTDIRAPRRSRAPRPSGATRYMMESSSGMKVIVPPALPIQDYLEAYTWFRWHSWFWPTMTAVYVIVFTVWFATGGSAMTVPLVLWTLWCVGSYFIPLQYCASRVQKAHLRCGEISYTFGATGFDVRTSVGTSKTLWAAVDRFVETRRSFVIGFATSAFLLDSKAFHRGDRPGSIS